MFPRSPQALNNLVPVRSHGLQSIVFIDSSMANWENLVQQVAVDARAIVIGSEDNGVLEISKILAQSDCLEVHIFSSGYPGCMYLGNSEISINTLSKYSLAIGKWFITNNSVYSVRLPRLYLSGHNLAVGDVGEEFLTKLNLITGAKIVIHNSLSESNILS